MIRSYGCWDEKTLMQVSDYTSRMLWRFIQKNAAESEAEDTFLNLTGLKRKDLELLADIRFLLSDSVDLLINQIAPKIINRLSKESVNEYITDRSRVRGRIDWQRTVKARCSAGGDPSVFSCVCRSQVFDLPENRLFLFLLRQINLKSKRLISETDAEINPVLNSEQKEKKNWTRKISAIAYNTSILLKNPYVKKIGGLHEISEKLIESSSRNRHEHYRLLADVGREYLACINTPLKYLKAKLKNNILEPLNYDTLFEIAVLFKTLQVLLDEGWKEKKVGLIGGSSKSISMLEKGRSRVNLFTQKLPDDLKRNSAYNSLMTNYGLSEKYRRPDIILEFSDSNTKHFLIVEVKRSVRRAYLADGSYKLLGYLKDYNGIVSENTKISGFLVGWGGIADREFNPHNEVNLFNWNNLSDGVAMFLKTLNKQAVIS